VIHPQATHFSTRHIFPSFTQYFPTTNNGITGIGAEVRYAFVLWWFCEGTKLALCEAQGCRWDLRTHQGQAPHQGLPSPYLLFNPNPVTGHPVTNGNLLQRKSDNVAWWHHVTHHVTHCAGFHPATFCPGLPPSNNNNFNRFISLTTPLLFPRQVMSPLMLLLRYSINSTTF
jgi:hypothetical protein